MIADEVVFVVGLYGGIFDINVYYRNSLKSDCTGEASNLCSVTEYKV